MKDQQRATEGMLTIPPAVCDILGQAVHLTGRERSVRMDSQETGS